MAHKDCIDHGKRGSSDFGYASAWFHGKTMLAHRVAYCIANGLIPDQIKNLVIRHSCDNPRCVNINHLEAGTTLDNVRDRVKRGRSKGAARKLSREQVLFIRENCNPSTRLKSWVTQNHEAFTYNKLANMFGVDSTVIRNIHTGKTYKEIK